MRYVIIGAGAVGCAIGGRLALTGVDTVLVARGDHLAAMQRGGLRVRTPDFDRCVPVTAVAGPEDVQLQTTDVLVAATKTQQLLGALVDWADRPVFNRGRETGRTGSSLPLFCATNGVAAEALAARYFAEVFGVCVWLPATRLTPGEVIVRGTPVSGVLHLGRVPGSITAERTSIVLDRVATDWTAAGYQVPLPADVMPWKYRKLISNLGNVFEALLGPGVDADELQSAADREARGILDAAGIAYTDEATEQDARTAGFSIGEVPGVHDHLGGSTWQSLTRGTGDVETDYLNGEIARIAHTMGMIAPVNERLARLGRRAARTGAKPGDLSIEALTAELTGDVPRRL